MIMRSRFSRLTVERRVQRRRRTPSSVVEQRFDAAPGCRSACRQAADGLARPRRLNSSPRGASSSRDQRRGPRGWRSGRRGCARRRRHRGRPGRWSARSARAWPSNAPSPSSISDREVVGVDRAEQRLEVDEHVLQLDDARPGRTRPSPSSRNGPSSAGPSKRISTCFSPNSVLPVIANVARSRDRVRGLQHELATCASRSSVSVIAPTLPTSDAAHHHVAAADEPVARLAHDHVDAVVVA